MNAYSNPYDDPADPWYTDPLTCKAIRLDPPGAAVSDVDFVETTAITIVCKFCGSTNVIKYGSKHGTQYYRCKACERKFAGNNALPGMRFPPDQIASALNMFYEGLSLNAIRRHLQHDHGILPSDATVYEWMVRFTKQARAPLHELIVQVGDTWVIDETVLRLDKQNAWFWDMIDDETRFLMASHLTMSRTMQAAVETLRRGQSIVDRSPQFIISDGLASYPDAVDRVFGADARHIRSRGFTHPVNTNLIERFHGTLKQRTKVMRGMQNIETARLVMDGWLIHYNFFRSHETLNGKTPGEIAKANYPWRSWRDVVMHGYISTEHRVTHRAPT